MRLLASILVGATAALVVGCARLQSASPDSPSPNLGPASLATCEQAFRRWVDGAAALNSPGADLTRNLEDQELIQRRVFELCSLENAERLNREMPLVVAPGISKPMIEPNFRTFASVECVDESPLLDGTRLCAEVGH
jgi:hypothetical protein